jgi:hypothetical protein
LVSHVQENQPAEDPGPFELTIVYTWLDLRTGSATEVASTVQQFFLDVRRGKVPASRDIPFSASSHGVVWCGNAAISQGGPRQIESYDATGRLTRIARLGGARQPVTRRVLDDLIETRSQGKKELRRFLEDLYLRMPLPDSLPTFEAVMVDDAGLLWAALYELKPEAPRSWIVFDTTGRAIGSVATPAGLRIHQIGAEFVLGVRRDSLGVERVESYGLVRGVQRLPSRGD